MMMVMPVLRDEVHFNLAIQNIEKVFFCQSPVPVLPLSQTRYTGFDFPAAL